MTLTNTNNELLIIRELRGSTELAWAEDLQFLVWGGSEREILPSDMMRAFEHAGGLVAGAFATGQENKLKLVGLVVGFPTAKAHIQHSHLLAVDPDFRGSGLALKLKEFQRDWCLARGISQIEWTYDPLRALNAHFNIHRLGASAHEYLDDFYGKMGGINAGIPSDRLVAIWMPNEPRPKQIDPLDLPAINNPNDGALLSISVEGSFDKDSFNKSMGLRLYVPKDLGHLLTYNPALALAWRLNTRQSFHALLSKGYMISDFVKGEQPAYVLTRPTF